MRFDHFQFMPGKNYDKLIIHDPNPVLHHIHPLFI